MLADLHKALKPGGWFGVVDHSAPAGTGIEHALDRDKGTHRIDEAYVKKLFAEAGFVLEASNDVLRNPADDRTKPFYDESFRGKSTDRFVLRFTQEGRMNHALTRICPAARVPAARRRLPPPRSGAR